jgi:hypothetical protein
MTKLWQIFCAGALVLAGTASAASAAEAVGKAVKINVTVTGTTGPKSTGDVVYRDEQLRANATGVGQFQLNDGTKLALGPNASIVIDNYVLGEGGTIQRLTLRATKGAFRWISGRSSSAAYRLVTPAGVLGIRGTAVDVQIGSGDTVAVVQLSGSSRFCLDPRDPSTCRDLRRRCDIVVAKPGRITDPKRVSREAVAGIGGGGPAFPFLRDNSKLLPDFRAGNACSLGRRAEGPRGQDRPDRPETQPGSPN